MNSATKHIVKDVTFNRSELNESKPFSLGFRNHDEKDITELADHERKVFEESPQAAAADDEEVQSNTHQQMMRNLEDVFSFIQASTKNSMMMEE